MDVENESIWPSEAIHLQSSILLSSLPVSFHPVLFSRPSLSTKTTFSFSIATCTEKANRTSYFLLCLLKSVVVGTIE